jgi:hypothetical protein
MQRMATAAVSNVVRAPAVRASELTNFVCSNLAWTETVGTAVGFDVGKLVGVEVGACVGVGTYVGCADG